jgi:hypothetical protein
MSGLERNFRG